LSKLVFDEHSLEQSLKSMVYFCKYYLKQEINTKSNINYEMEINESLFPISQKLFDTINYNQEFKAIQIQNAFTTNTNLECTNSVNNDKITNTENENSDSEKNHSKNGTIIKTGPINRVKNLSKKSLFPIFFDISY
jgi:hypothetical protein